MPVEWWQQEEDIEDFGMMLRASRQAGVSRQAGQTDRQVLMVKKKWDEQLKGKTISPSGLTESFLHPNLSSDCVLGQILSLLCISILSL